MKEYKTYYKGNLRECKVLFSVGELADGELSQCSDYLQKTITKLIMI